VVAITFGVVLEGGSVNSVAVELTVWTGHRPVGLVADAGVPNHKSLALRKAKNKLSTALVVAAVVPAEGPFWELDAGSRFGANRYKHRKEDPCGKGGSGEAGFRHAGGGHCILPLGALQADDVTMMGFRCSDKGGAFPISRADGDYSLLGERALARQSGFMQTEARQQFRTNLMGVAMLTVVAVVATALRIQVPVLLGQLFAMLLSLAPQSASIRLYLTAGSAGVDRIIGVVQERTEWEYQ
jgi:hypothetical protein